jgi:hypothetical protein
MKITVEVPKIVETRFLSTRLHVVTSQKTVILIKE